MAVKWVDRVPTYPNRMKITPENGDAYYATVERADEPVVLGTPLNAENLNAMQSEEVDISGKQDKITINGIVKGDGNGNLSAASAGTDYTTPNTVQPIKGGGTGANTGAAALKNLFAAGATVLSSYQYGDELPSTGTAGQIFFLKV